MSLRAEIDSREVPAARRILGWDWLDNRSLRYRPDIDGLRALAVAIVVIFHTGVSPIRGGFIGVDIFFVISGFLITGLLLRDIEADRFSLATFYERRIRRIFPAMMVMLAIVLAAAPLLLFAPERRITALTGFASLLSSANLYLMAAAGYFEADALTQPLLHMWSLGVEEQFYLLFPLILLVLHRVAPRHLSLAVIGITLASLLASILVTIENRDVAYFLPLTRAWELLLGALLIVIPSPRLPRILREVGALAALFLIVACAFRFYPSMAFPGWVAAIPCLAAVALIAIGSQGGSLVSRFFSLRPVVFLGQISYSLYLWHWPIIVGYRLVNGGAISLVEALLLVIASLVAATLSWYFVERPFREKRLLSVQVPLFRSAAISTLLLAGLSAILLFLSFPPAAPSDADRLASYLTYDDAPVYRRGRCFLVGHLNRLADFQEQTCLAPAADKENVLLVGDSHGAHLWSGLSTAIPEAHVLQATSTGCKPVLGTRGEATCRALMQSVFDRIEQGFRPDVLILSARWEASDLPLLLDTITALRSKVGRLVVSGPIVEYGVALPRLLAQVAGGRDPSLLVSARKNGLALDQQIEAAVKAAGADYFSTYRLFCRDETAACQTLSPAGVPLQWDYGHLTADGSALVGQAIRTAGLLSAH